MWSVADSVSSEFLVAKEVTAEDSNIKWTMVSGLIFLFIVNIASLLYEIGLKCWSRNLNMCQSRFREAWTIVRVFNLIYKPILD